MKKPNNNLLATTLQSNTIRLSRVHFGLVAAYVVFIIGCDSWNLVTRELTSQRWIMAGLLLIVTTVVGFLARGNVHNPTYYRILIIALILADIGLATFSIYTERGMSSRGVALYAIPIVSAAALLNRSALFGAAFLSTASYFMAATRYFYVNFNEGYKIELYSTVWLYSVGFFVLAAIVWIVLTPAASVNKR